MEINYGNEEFVHKTIKAIGTKEKRLNAEPISVNVIRLLVIGPKHKIGP